MRKFFALQKSGLKNLHCGVKAMAGQGKRDEEIREILKTSRFLAVVGMSRDPAKSASGVPRFLRRKGYVVFPVNPNTGTIEEGKSYKSILNVEREIDTVVIFRPSDRVMPVVREAVDRHLSRGDVKVIWMQEGIQNDAAARLAEDAGISVVQDRCMAKEYRRLMEG